MAEDLRCPTCQLRIDKVVYIKTAGATIAVPCGHEVIAVKDTRDTPGSVRIYPPGQRHGEGA